MPLLTEKKGCFFDSEVVMKTFFLIRGCDFVSKVCVLIQNLRFLHQNLRQINI